MKSIVIALLSVLSFATAQKDWLSFTRLEIDPYSGTATTSGALAKLNDDMGLASNGGKITSLFFFKNKSLNI